MDDGLLKVQQVAEHFGVSGSLVRGQWCLIWERAGLAHKVFNAEFNREEWRIDPGALEHVPAWSVARLFKEEGSKVAAEIEPSEAPLCCELVIKDTRVTAKKITIFPDGRIVAE